MNRYTYRDELGDPIARKSKRPGKKFFWEWNDLGEWKAGKGPLQELVYNLPALQTAKESGAPLVIVEGEKDCDTLDNIHVPAITAGGANDFKAYHAKKLKGVSELWICVDNDEPGEKLANNIKELCSAEGIPLKYLKLPNELLGKPVKDITDYLEAGGSWGALENKYQSAKLYSAKTDNCLSAFEMLQEIPDRRPWVISDLLLENEIILIHAFAKSGKTYLDMSLGFALATGQSFLSFNIPQQKSVCAFDGELGPELVATRVHQIALGFPKPLTSEHTFNFYCLNSEKVKPNLADPNDQKAYFEPRIKEHDVIIIDAILNCAWEFERNQAETQWWRSVSSFLKKWQAKGKSFILIHHQTKGKEMYGSVIKINDADSIIALRPPIYPKHYDGQKTFTLTYDQVRSWDSSKANNKCIAFTIQETDDSPGVCRWQELDAEQEFNEQVRSAVDDMGKRHAAKELGISAHLVDRIMSSLELKDVAGAFTEGTRYLEEEIDPDIF